MICVLVEDKVLSVTNGPNRAGPPGRTLVVSDILWKRRIVVSAAVTTGRSDAGRTGSEVKSTNQTAK